MRAVATVAARQHGAITLSQAGRAGLSTKEVRALVKTGAWARRSREVFTVSGAPATYEGDVMVACLAGGPRAAACRGTAARLLGVGRPWFDHAVVEIALPRGASGHAVAAVGAVAHSYRHLHDGDYARIGVIPTTSAARLVVDLLGVRPADALYAVTDDVLHRRWATPSGIRRCWGEASGRHRTLLDAALLPWAPGPKPGSPKEMALSRLLQLHGLPRPLRQYEVHVPGSGPRFLDLAYPEAKVAPEYDGRRDHGARQWACDAGREDELASIGWLRLPAGASDLTEPGATAYCEQVRAALAARGA